ncbi:hypothetical protein PV327_011246, partial [Microctonus hyperodae]
MQRKKWIDAVKQQNAYSADWQPKDSDLICSAHFIGNKKGEDVFSPSYTPTKFSKTPVVNEKSIISRHNRFLKRRLADKQQFNISTAAIKVKRSSSSTVPQCLSDQENINVDNHHQTVNYINKTQDQGCQANTIVDCNEFDKVFSCNIYYIMGQNTCDAKIQTDINIPAGPVKIPNQKRYKNQSCGTLPKSSKNIAVGPDLPIEIENTDQITFQGCVMKDEQLNDLTGVNYNTFNFLMKKLNVPRNVTVSKKK